jgi:hypothetical protein
MHPITALLAAEHLRELRRDAAENRLAKVMDDDTTNPGGPVRRLVGRGARSLSSALGSVAARMDPAPVDGCVDGSGPSALAA